MWLRVFLTTSICYSSLLFSQEILAPINSNQSNISTLNNHSFDYSIFDKVTVQLPTTNHTEVNPLSANHQANSSLSSTDHILKYKRSDNVTINSVERKITIQEPLITEEKLTVKVTQDQKIEVSLETSEDQSNQQPQKELSPTERKALDAFNNGRLFRAQFKDELALEQLKYAADLGHVDAQFLYGITRLTYQPSARTKPIARDYLFKAGEQGHLRAMFELISREGMLSREQQLEWENTYLEKIETIAEENPAKGYFLLYEYYDYQHDSEQAELFFEQALAEEHPQALFIHGQKILNGEGLFFSSQARYEEANLWLQKSAEKSYLPAYRLLINNYEALGDYEQAFYWRSQLLDMGDLLSLTHLGKIFLGQSKAGYDKFIDKQQGLDYLALYLQTAGTDRMQGVYSNVEKIYNKAIETLTEEELKQHQDSLETHYTDLVLFNFDIYLWLTLPDK